MPYDKVEMPLMDVLEAFCQGGQFFELEILVPSKFAEFEIISID